jgi:hypothetical protein
VLEPEIVESTVYLHNGITDMVGAQPDVVLENATALDGADDVLNANATLGNQTIFSLLRVGERLALGLLVWHADGYIGKSEAEKAEILQQFTAWRKRVGRRIGERLFMAGALECVREKEDPGISVG